MSSPFSPLTSEIDEVAAATPLSPAEAPADGLVVVMKFLSVSLKITNRTKGDKLLHEQNQTRISENQQKEKTPGSGSNLNRLRRAVLLIGAHQR